MTHSKAPEKPPALRIGEALQAVTAIDRAPAMQADLKSTMTYLGVSSAPCVAALKPIIVEVDTGDGDAWQREVLAIWRGAAFRGERDAALALTGKSRSPLPLGRGTRDVRRNDRDGCVVGLC